MRVPLACASLALALAAALAPTLAAAGHDQTLQPEVTGAGVRIAVLDTGVDSSHPELSGRVTRQSFAQPAVPLPVPGALPLAEDPDGQGTAVASVAAGATLGQAPAAHVVDLQVSAKYTQQAGPAAIDPATEAAAIEAMDTLLRDPSRAHVVLMSFAQDGVSEQGGRTLAQQARGLWDEGVLVVVPAGPSANPLSSAAHVVTVAGVEPPCPAAMGPGIKPDLVAPSQDIQAAQPGDGVNPGGAAPESGTALAAAQVAGVAALLIEAKPELPVDALASFLRDAATDLGDTGPDACFGFGRLDAGNALEWAAGWDDPLQRQGGRDAPALGVAGLAAVLAAAAVAHGRRERR